MAPIIGLRGLRRKISARRELHALAEIVASTCPRVKLERTLRVLHPSAAGALPDREVAAIVELASRPLRSDWPPPP